MTPLRVALTVALLLAPLAAQAQDPPPPLKEVRPDTQGPCYSIAFGAEERYVAVGGKDGVRLLSPARFAGNPKAPLRLLPHPGYVDQVEFVAKRKILITKSANQTRAWDAGDHRPIQISPQDVSLFGFAYRESSSGRSKEPALVLTGRKDGMRIWIPQNRRGNRLPVRELHVRQRAGVRFGRITAAGATDAAMLLGNEKGNLYLLDGHRELLGAGDRPPSLLSPVMNHASKPRNFRAHSGAITSISMAVANTLCMTAGTDGKVRMWDVASLSKDAPKPKWEIPGRIAALSESGRFMAVARPDGVGVYHAESGIALSWNPRNAKSGRIVRLRFNSKGTVLSGIECRCAACRTGRDRAGILHGGTLVVLK